jgi:hypothetical protein
MADWTSRPVRSRTAIRRVWRNVAVVDCWVVHRYPTGMRSVQSEHLERKCEIESPVALDRQWDVRPIESQNRVVERLPDNAEIRSAGPGIVLHDYDPDGNPGSHVRLFAKGGIMEGVHTRDMEALREGMNYHPMACTMDDRHTVRCVLDRDAWRLGIESVEGR